MNKILKTLIDPTEIEGYETEKVSWQKIALMVIIVVACLLIAAHGDYLNFRSMYPNL